MDAVIFLLDAIVKKKYFIILDHIFIWIDVNVFEREEGEMSIQWSSIFHAASLWHMVTLTKLSPRKT